MKSFLVVLAVIVLLVVVVGGSLAGTYNKLVKLNEDVNGKWAQVENQLQRRFDLIPNMVSVTQGYAAHEKAVFQGIADARAKLAGTKNATLEDRVTAANEMETALSRLLVIVENYPQLKADAQFRALSDELTGTENRIAVERMRFNESVKSFNETVKQFPMVMFARVFGYAAKPYFLSPEEAKTAPQVKF